MKDPDIPGRIMLQMATTPHKNIYAGCGFSLIGLIRRIAAAMQMPAITARMEMMFHLGIRVATRKIEATISPKKMP